MGVRKLFELASRMDKVGVTLTNFFASAFGAVSLVEVLTRWLTGDPFRLSQGTADSISFVVITVAVAFLNRGLEAIDAEVRAIELNINNPSAQSHDLWTGQTDPLDHGLIKAHIPSHAVVMLEVK